MAATLVLLLASSNDPPCLDNALKSQSRSLGGLPTYTSIKKTPSASLPLAFRRAKLAAVIERQTTVLAVALVDVHIFELAQRGVSEPYFSFAHVFTIGVGPEGVIIWQAWGKHGYRLDEYLNNGHGRIRDWSEADQFVRDFDKLATQKVSSPRVCINARLIYGRVPGIRNATSSIKGSSMSILTKSVDRVAAGIYIIIQLSSLVVFINYVCYTLSQRDLSFLITIENVLGDT
jgi:hypothetical protein